METVTVYILLKTFSPAYSYLHFVVIIKCKTNLYQSSLWYRLVGSVFKVNLVFSPYLSIIGYAYSPGTVATDFRINSGYSQELESKVWHYELRTRPHYHVLESTSMSIQENFDQYVRNLNSIRNAWSRTSRSDVCWQLKKWHKRRSFSARLALHSAQVFCSSWTLEESMV